MKINLVTTITILGVLTACHPMPPEAALRAWESQAGPPCLYPRGERRFDAKGNTYCPDDPGYEFAQAPKTGRRYSASGVPLMPGEYGYPSGFRWR